MTSAQPCPGSCNSRWRRLKAIYDVAVENHARIVALSAEGDEIPEPPRKPDVEPAVGEPVWCKRCASIIRQELADFDELAAHLAALPPGIRPAVERRHERVKVSGTHAAPSPSPSGDEMDDLLRWLQRWEREYRAHRDWPTPAPRGYLAGKITAGVAWLGEHLDGILTTEWAETFGTETRQWHRNLVSTTHAARSAKHVKKACPRCRLYTLWEEIGQDYIRCVNEDCNRRMTREELDDAQSTAVV